MFNEIFNAYRLQRLECSNTNRNQAPQRQWRERTMNLDLGIESVTKFFDDIAYYGAGWLVEFRDYSRVLVIENDDNELNFVFPEVAAS